MTHSPTMKQARRAASALIVFLGTCLLTAIPTLALFGSQGMALLIPLIAAVAASGYVWAHANDIPSHLIPCIFYGAVLFGGVGFAAGFLGPMILAPNANQGPLLGIFVTGPVGVLIGAVAGLAYGLLKLPRREH
jgi:hypothetical protein